MNINPDGRGENRKIKLTNYVYRYAIIKVKILVTYMEHFFKPSKYFLTYGPNEPALRIKSGDTIIVPTVDAHDYDSNDMMVPKEMMQSREDTLLHPSNLLSGPFYIEDAEVGDTLIVHIENIKLNRPTAWSAVVPHFGSFTEEDRRRRFLLNEPLERMTFDWRLE